MTVTLVIGNENLRLVALKGSRVEFWDNLIPPAGCIKDGIVLQPQILAAYLKTYFSSKNLGSRKIHLGIRGISLIFRKLKLPKVRQNKLKEAVERAMCKEVHLDLNSLYLDWRVTDSKDRDMDILVLGVSRQIIDSFSEVFKLAGLRLGNINLNAFALCSAAGKETALIVDMESESTDIIIVDRGIPQTLHTFSGKNSRASFEDNLNLMQDEFNRTVDFFTLTHPEIALSNTLPLILCGSFTADKNAVERIAEITGRPIETVVPDLSAPQGFPAAVFAANVGLLPNKSTGLLSTNRSTISLDFLEARRRTLRQPLQMKKLVLSVGVAVAILVFIAEWLIHNQTAVDTQVLRGQLSGLTNSLSMARDEQQKSLDTLNSIQTLNASTQALTQERQQLEGQGQLDRILDTIVKNLPQGTSIQQTQTTPQEIILEGEALQYPDIISYIHKLEESGLFSDIRITSMQQNASENQTSVCLFQLNIQR